MGVVDFVRDAGAKIGIGQSTAEIDAKEAAAVKAAHDAEAAKTAADAATAEAARKERITAVANAKIERVNAARVASDAVDRADGAKADKLEAYVTGLGLAVNGLDIVVHDGVAVVKGEVSGEDVKQKVVLAVGNVEGIDTVDEQLAVTAPLAAPVAAPEPVAAPAPAPEPVHYTVVAGDSLSKIARQFYGDGNRYPEIFAANQPPLTDADQIYPGQVLVIPGV